MVLNYSDKKQIQVMESKKESNEIDVIALLVKVWKHKLSLAICLSVALSIGIVVALNKPKEYTSQVMLAPEVNAGGMNLPSNISDMASNLGIDLGSKSSIDAIYPDIYPSVLSSTDFIMGLFNTSVRLKDNDTIRTYKQHLLKDKIVPFWDYPKNWLINLIKKKGNVGQANAEPNKLIISNEDWNLCDNVSNSILCTVDKKTSVISISVTDQDPLVATIMVDTIQSRLQDYITQYKTKKARNDAEYYKKLMIKAKKDYEDIRRKYSSYSDANMDVVLQSVKSKTEDMENDMQLKYNSYTALNTQYQAAVAKIQEKTPAFTIIQKPYMPYKPSSTPRSYIVLLYILIGGMIDLIWVFFKERKNIKIKAE